MEEVGKGVSGVNNLLMALLKPRVVQEQPWPCGAMEN
jgi:hypothetical protein